MVAEKQGPLRRFRNRRRLLQYFDNGNPILHPQGHEHAWHQWKMKRHMAFIPASRTKIGDGILRPLIGFRQQHPVGVIIVHMFAQALQEVVGFGQVFATGAISLEQVGHGIQSHAIHA